jgi:ERCC4-type nuclease
MIQETTTPVAHVQELIAILSTRKEACEKILALHPDIQDSAQLKGCLSQTDRFISELTGELSQFGDAVQSEANRDNAYQHQWREALQGIDASGAERVMHSFHTMEETLAQTYRQLAGVSGLPESLHEVLSKQSGELNPI